MWQDILVMGNMSAAFKMYASDLWISLIPLAAWLHWRICAYIACLANSRYIVPPEWRSVQFIWLKTSRLQEQSIISEPVFDLKDQIEALEDSPKFDPQTNSSWWQAADVHYIYHSYLRKA